MFAMMAAQKFGSWSADSMVQMQLEALQNYTQTHGLNAAQLLAESTRKF